MWTSSSFHQNATCSCHDIAKKYSLGIEQQSLAYSLKNGNKYQNTNMVNFSLGKMKKKIIFDSGDLYFILKYLGKLFIISFWNLLIDIVDLLS